MFSLLLRYWLQVFIARLRGICYSEQLIHRKSYFYKKKTDMKHFWNILDQFGAPGRSFKNSTSKWGQTGIFTHLRFPVEFFQVFIQLKIILSARNNKYLKDPYQDVVKLSKYSVVFKATWNVRVFSNFYLVLCRLDYLAKMFDILTRGSLYKFRVNVGTQQLASVLETGDISA